MRLTELRVQNYRSIVDSGDIRIEPFQAIVGENNAGKSNLLNAVQVFLTSGAGVNEADFFDTTKTIVITANFSELSKNERMQLRRYLLGDKLIIEKHIYLQEDKRTSKIRPKAEYHGYIATPKDWWLSIEGVLEHEDTTKPKWEQIANEHGIIDYVRDPKSGKVNKTSYAAGLSRFLIENEDIEYNEPELGDTQALGLPAVLLDNLPAFRLLPAITDYSNEIDKRASQTNFRLLMGDLADRILKNDPRYQQIEKNIYDLTCLLNAPQEAEQRGEDQQRLATLGAVEGRLTDIISRLMPSVCGVRVNVQVDEMRDIFSKGVSVQVDDGRLTEVLMKGHGLQRCVVFGLLQALIMNQRGQLIELPDGEPDTNNIIDKTIILAIEEPELFIHPQMQRLIYGVLSDFSATDQVIYSTHSPAFVDVAKYESIAVTAKASVAEGTTINQCEPGTLDNKNERKDFQFFSSFGIEQNKMFFSQNIILVEGEEDVVGVLATGRHLGLFREFPEEIGYTLIPTQSKNEMPKYIKLLNGFGIPYTILHELDGTPDSDENKVISDLCGNNKRVELPNRLEEAAGHQGHFRKLYSAMKFFENADNIAQPLKDAVAELFK